MPATDTLSIGPATAADASAIAGVHVRCWQQAYRHLLPAPYLAELSVSQREAMWLVSLTRREPEVLIARMGTDVLGFIAYGAPRDGERGVGRAEVWAAYVEPTCWSLGVGSALWNVARDRMAREGADELVVWVFRDNARGLRFFRHAGFEPDAGRVKTVHVAGASLPKLRHRLRVQGSLIRPREAHSAAY